MGSSSARPSGPNGGPGLPAAGAAGGFSAESSEEFRKRAREGAFGAENAGQLGGRTRGQVETELFQRILEEETQKREQKSVAERQRERAFAGRQAVLNKGKDQPGTRTTTLGGSFLTGFGA